MRTEEATVKMANSPAGYLHGAPATTIATKRSRRRRSRFRHPVESTPGSDAGTASPPEKERKFNGVPAQMFGKHQNQRYLDELRRLQPEETQINPPLRPLHGEPQRHDAQQEQQRKAVQEIRLPQKFFVPYLESEQKSRNRHCAQRSWRVANPAPALKTGAGA